MTSTNGNGSKGLLYFLIAFLTVFLAAGGYCLYLGLTAYFEGAPITSPDVFVYLLVGGTFIAGPGYFLVSALRDEEPPAPPEDAPWTVRPAWQTNTLTEETSSNGSTLWAVFWNLITWPLAGVILYAEVWQSPDPEWPVLFVLIFPAVGIGFAWSALKKVLHRWKFGTSTLRMETMPGRLGRRLQARLQAPIAPDETPENGFHVQLSCYRRYVDHTGKSSTVKKDLKWRDEKHLRGQPSSEKDGGTEVPISFELPSDQPPSTPNKTTERMLWELGASADIEGLDYEISFEIPVFEPSDQEMSRSAEGTEDSGGADPSRLQVEDADDGTSRHERPAESTPDPYAEHEVGDDFTEPVSDGIRMEGRPGRGLTFSFAPARAKGVATFLTAVGLPCLAGGVYSLTVSLMLTLFLLLFGAVFTYAAWQKWTQASTLSIDDGHIELTKGPFGQGTTTRLPCEDLKDVHMEAQRETLGTAYYSLALVRADSGAHSGGKSKARPGRQAQQRGAPEGPEQTDGSEDGIGIGAGAEKKIRVAGDLTNKQEADWIAERILEAARREASFHSRTPDNRSQ